MIIIEFFAKMNTLPDLYIIFENLKSLAGCFSNSERRSNSRWTDGFDMHRPVLALIFGSRCRSHFLQNATKCFIQRKKLKIGIVQLRVLDFYYFFNLSNIFNDVIVRLKVSCVNYYLCFDIFSFTFFYYYFFVVHSLKCLPEYPVNSGFVCYQ